MKAKRLRAFYFFLFVSYGAFLPFFPAWLEARGIRGVTMSALMALLPALGVVGPPLFGALSDWLGLRTGLLRITTAGGLLAMLLLALPGALGHTPGLVLLFLSMVLFAVSRTPSVAMTDVITVELVKRPEPAGKAESYGSIRLGGSLGFLVAALAVGKLLDIRALAALPLFLAAATLVTFGLSFTIEAAPPERAHNLGASIAILLRERAYVMLLLAVFLGFGAHAGYDICFSLHLQRLGFSAGWVGVAWGIGTLAETVLMAFSGRILAAAPAQRLLIFAFAGGAVRWLLIATVTSLPVLLLLQPLHAVSFAVFWVTAVDHVKRLAPEQVLGTAQGLFNAATGAGAVAGMFVWRALFDARGGAAMFMWAAVAAGCAAVAAAGTTPRPRASQPELL